MASAEQFFGVSRPNLRADLESFYADAEAAIVKANPAMRGQLENLGHLPVNELPYKERAALMGRYRQIIGFDQAILSLQNTGNVSLTGRKESIFNNLRNRFTLGNPYGQMPRTYGTLLSDLYNQMNVQYTPDRVKYDMAGLVDPGAVSGSPQYSFVQGRESIPSRGATLGSSPSAQDLRGKRVLTYDLETAGFRYGEIREVAYKMSDEASMRPSQYYTPKGLLRGVVNVNGRAGSVNDLLRKKYGIATPNASTGTDFARGIESFLDAILEADYVAGHNIIGFDNEQLFMGVSSTDRFKKDAAFRNKAERAFEKLRTSSVDTLRLARSMPGLEGLGVAKALANAGEGSVYSISNLLLQTDLMDRIGMENLAGMMGYDRSTRSFKYGLHHAAIDTSVTEAIVDSLQDGGLKLKDLSTQRDARLAHDIQNMIVRSSAITPFTNLAGPEEVLDDVLDYLLRATADGGVSTGLSGLSRADMRRLSQGNASEVFNRLRSGASSADIKINPVQQAILSQRDLTPIGSLSTTDDVTSLIGTVATSKSPSLPGTRLSRAERELGAALSGATKELASMTQSEKRLAAVTTDALIGRFDLFSSDNVQFVSRSGAVSLPSQILGDMDLLSDNDMMRLSIVDSSLDDSTGAINLVRQLTDGEAEKVASQLEALSSLSDSELKSKLGSGASGFRAAMSDGQLTENIRQFKRINVAQVYGAGDQQEAVNTVRSAMLDFFNQNKAYIKDDLTFEFAAPLMDIDYESGRARTAGVVFDGVMTESDRTAGIEELVRHTREYESRVGEATRGRVAYKQAVRSAKYQGEGVLGAWREAAQNAAPISKGIYRGGAALGVVTIAAVLLGKRRERELVNETIDFQGYESPSQGQYAIYDQIEERKAAGYRGDALTFDPLRTSHLINNLNNDRMGHTNMHWDSNNNIYGGIL